MYFLLVENDPNQVERISVLLNQANHSVLAANCVEEASEALSLQKFDAVLLGISLSGGDHPHGTAILPAGELERRGVKTPIMPLREPIDADALSNEVMQLTRSEPQSTPHEAGAASLDLPIFEPDSFKAQVFDDRELMVEIINLFLEEELTQVAEMREALAANNYESLHRIAHTIKGSLGSLHAEMARWRAELLESSARKCDEQVCRDSLAALEQALALLRPRLLSLRESDRPL